MDGEPVETDLWQRYKTDNDLAARDRLVRRYQPWASAIARNVHRRLRSWPVDGDDFAQNAALGLIEAIARFDPTRGIPFQAYAAPRVRGAVFNGLRAILADRPATRARHAERLRSLQEGAAEDVLQRIVDTVTGLGLGFLLDHAASEPADRMDGLYHAHSAQVRARLLGALDQLPPRLQAIIRGHYFEHTPFVELAEREAVSKGRISQLHRDALLRLRKLMADDG